MKLRTILLANAAALVACTLTMLVSSALAQDLRSSNAALTNRVVFTQWTRDELWNLSNATVESRRPD
jgi:hypothetical protein